MYRCQCGLQFALSDLDPLMGVVGQIGIAGAFDPGGLGFLAFNIDLDGHIVLRFSQGIYYQQINCGRFIFTHNPLGGT